MANEVTRPPRVLIIENDFLIGEMIHDMVRELGYDVTNVANRLPAALREISKDNFEGALLNIGLDEQKHGIEIADIFIEKNIPFGFVTGYGRPLEGRHEHIPLLQKPFTQEQLRHFVENVIGPSESPNHNTSRVA
jgi:CheY-like chemotaxis protein